MFCMGAPAVIAASVIAEEQSYQERVDLAKGLGAEPPERNEHIPMPVEKDCGNNGLFGALIGFIFGASL